MVRSSVHARTTFLNSPQTLWDPNIFLFELLHPTGLYFIVAQTALRQNVPISSDDHAVYGHSVQYLYTALSLDLLSLNHSS